MNFFSHMVNAWSLAGSILNGTFDKDYPMTDTKITPQESDEYDIPHSDYYYDYTRNDPNRENPFTDPVDRKRAEYVVSGGDTACEDDELDYEVNYYDDYIADIDDQRAHHFNFYGDLKKSMDYEPQRNHQYKYHEQEILKDIEEYVSRTYQGHYTGTKHEFRKVQTIDLMAARDIAAQFCQANILKYGSRYGSKDGRNKTDLLKVIHYAMLLLHFDGHYGEPSMPTGNFDQMP